MAGLNPGERPPGADERPAAAPERLALFELLQKISWTDEEWVQAGWTLVEDDEAAERLGIAKGEWTAPWRAEATCLAVGATTSAPNSTEGRQPQTKMRASCRLLRLKMEMRRRLPAMVAKRCPRTGCADSLRSAWSTPNLRTWKLTVPANAPKEAETLTSSSLLLPTM